MLCGARRINSLSPIPTSTNEKHDAELRTRVVFTGRVGGDRAVVADCSLPYFAPGLPHCLPFVWQLPSAAAAAPSTPMSPAAASGLHVELGPSLIAYFEITIEQPPAPAEEGPRRRAPAQQRGCVAVGVCSKKFPLSCRMPGWDAASCTVGMRM